MSPVPIVILPEINEFPLKILSIPKENVVKVFTTHRSD
jgi:hypothetical protein